MTFGRFIHFLFTISALAACISYTKTLTEIQPNENWKPQFLVWCFLIGYTISEFLQAVYKGCVENK